MATHTLRIGLTGCIGSGKSVVARVLAGLGVPVFSADKAAHKAMTQNPVIKSELMTLFGTGIYEEEGELNKKALAQCLFVSPDKKKKLESIVHTAVLDATELWFSQQIAPYAIKESALLGSVKQNWDGIIQVYAHESLCVQRALLRSPHLEGKILHQIFREQQAALSNLSFDYTLYNNEEDALLPQIWALHAYLQEKVLRNKSHL